MGSDRTLACLAGFGAALVMIGILLVLMDGYKGEIVVKVCDCECKKNIVKKESEA